MGRWRQKNLKTRSGWETFLFCAKVVLGYFGTTWGIFHRTSTKNYKRIEASPMALPRAVGLCLDIANTHIHNTPRYFPCPTFFISQGHPPIALYESKFGGEGMYTEPNVPIVYTIVTQ
jgi:hypothetical protein